jgi:hypothetical protein
MKKIWKWVLGILLVLIVVTALVAVPLVLHNRFSANFPANARMQNPRVDNGQPSGPMMGNQPRKGFDSFGGDNGRMSPRMGGGFSRFGGFTPFGMGFFFLGGLLRLIPLALLGLLGYGIYQLGKRAGVRSVQTSAPVSTVAPPPEPAPAAVESDQS